MLRRNCVSFSEGVRTEQFSIWTPDLDDPPFPRMASEKVETRGKWKPVSISSQQYIMLGGGGGQDRVVSGVFQKLSRLSLMAGPRLKVRALNNKTVQSGGP